jgi:hypothetical protein
MIAHTALNGILMGAIILGGYFVIMFSLRHKGAHTWTNCWLPLFLGLAMFFGGWFVEFQWMPEETFHCTHHCFPWGD